MRVLHVFAENGRPAGITAWGDAMVNARHKRWFVDIDHERSRTGRGDHS